MVILRKEERLLPEDGLYTAKVTKVENKPEGKFGPAFLISFQIIEEGSPYIGIFANKWVPSVWRVGNKLDKFLTALGVSVSEIGDEVESDNMVGKIVKIATEINDAGYVVAKEVYPIKKTTAPPQVHEPVVETVTPPVIETSAIVPKKQIRSIPF